MLQDDTKKKATNRSQEIRKIEERKNFCDKRNRKSNRNKEIIIDEHGLDWAEKWVKRWGDNWRLH